jgi:type I restriction enzyme R subunit
MSIHKERKYEDELVEHLTTHGWLAGDPAHYDRALALYPEDVLEWLQESQPEMWARRKSFGNGATERAVLERLAVQLDREGALAVLRHGFKDGNAHFQMCQFQPSHDFNPDLRALYKQVRCRVVRQLHYSPFLRDGKPIDKSIDVVLFVNGIPVATIELKTDFTQSIHDAIRQYRQDRLPRDSDAKQAEPLLTFGRRALVHFAVSSDAVFMTTKLQGAETDFLPFNLGDQGGAGNPANPSGYRTAYLWERVLERTAWLDILGRFINWEKKGTARERLVFPRYHQWDVVNQLEAAVRSEGPGRTYLIQHSAGSGKSNSIAWLAHRLSTLYALEYGAAGKEAGERKVFDSVIVVTDRTVLDKQLQETIYQIEHKVGVVTPITDEGVKSQQLVAALSARKPIIIVTIQTFPALLELLQRQAADDAGGADGAAHAPSFADGRYALIVDEAHSSQSAGTSHKLRQLLGSEGLGGDEEYSAEDELIVLQQARLLPPNMSVFAFTATPKAKTIELFGRPGPDGIPVAFHVYSMKQAIEEKFVLDVLRNYTPFALAYKLAYAGAEMDDHEIEKGEGLKQLRTWVRLNPWNIAQKVAVIVEHFRANIQPLLGGRAKAMVVTSSRKEAVRFKLAMEKYLLEQGPALGHRAIGVLVAFSGEVNDAESGPDAFSEWNMNPGLKGRDIRTAFETDEYQILIVANKFQTGFDQPLLVAMYVDKKLAGVNAVQTLSRLNRTCTGKKDTYVLDFVNGVEEIHAAFAPYYETAQLTGVSDPNIIHDLQNKLDDAQIYSEAEVELFAKAAVNPKAKQAEIQAAIAPAVDRFRKQWQAARAADDKAALDALTIFRKDMGTFVRVYEFLAQIYDYGDAGLEKRNMFFHLLQPWLRVENADVALDLSAVELTHYRLQDLGAQAIKLVQESGEEYKLKPITEVGTADARDPEMALLREIIAQMNELFAGDLSEADLVTYAHHISSKMMENEELAMQAAQNSREQFALGDFGAAFMDAILEGLDAYQSMAEQVLTEDRTKEGFKRLVLELVYQGFAKRRRQGEAA